MLTPNTVLISVAMAQAENTITKPINAAVIWLRADSVAALSPPERIQRKPPIMSMKKKIKPAITKTAVTAHWIIVSIVKSDVPKAAPGAFRLTVVPANTVDKNVISLSHLLRPAEALRIGGLVINHSLKNLSIIVAKQTFSSRTIFMNQKRGGCQAGINRGQDPERQMSPV